MLISDSNILFFQQIPIFWKKLYICTPKTGPIPSQARKERKQSSERDSGDLPEGKGRRSNVFKGS